MEPLAGKCTGTSRILAEARNLYTTFDTKSGKASTLKPPGPRMRPVRTPRSICVKGGEITSHLKRGLRARVRPRNSDTQHVQSPSWRSTRNASERRGTAADLGHRTP